MCAYVYIIMYICVHVYDVVCVCVYVCIRSLTYHFTLLAGFYSDATVKDRAALQEPFVQIASCLSAVGESLRVHMVVKESHDFP